MTYEQALKATQQQASMLHGVYQRQCSDREQMIRKVQRKLDAGEVLSPTERDVAEGYQLRAAV